MRIRKDRQCSAAGKGLPLRVLFGYVAAQHRSAIRLFIQFYGNVRGQRKAGGHIHQYTETVLLNECGDLLPVFFLVVLRDMHNYSATSTILVGAILAFRMAMLRAALPANSMKAFFITSSPLTITGTPSSPPSRMLCTRGIWPRKGISISSARRLPPSLPKM